MTPQELEAIWGLYDCQQAFCYLTGHQECPGPLAWADVREIVAQSEGERDERDWIAVGWLHDGRAFFLAAGCDYTGWDCRANGWSVIGPTAESVIHPLVIPDSERNRIRESLEVAGYTVHEDAALAGALPPVAEHRG